MKFFSEDGWDITCSKLQLWETVGNCGVLCDKCSSVSTNNSENYIEKGRPSNVTIDIFVSLASPYRLNCSKCSKQGGRHRLFPERLD